MLSHQTRVRSGSRIHKYESVPEILIKVGLCLPDGCNVRDMEWTPVQVESPTRLDIRQVLLRIPNALPPQPTPEEIAAEVDRVMTLVPADRRAWLGEQQRKMDAFDLYAKGGVR